MNTDHRCRTLIAMLLLSACQAAQQSDQHADLRAWLIAVRENTARAATSAMPSTISSALSNSPSPSSDLLSRDPFAPSPTSNPTPAKLTLRMLGTLRSGAQSYALLQADQQILCLPVGAALPPYRIAAISDAAVTLEHGLPDGRSQRSTLWPGNDHVMLSDNSMLSAAPMPSNQVTDTRLSLHLKDIELRALLPTLARCARINLVLSDSVKGKLSADLNQLSWQQTLTALLRSKRFAQQQIGAVLWIATPQELAQHAKDTPPPSADQPLQGKLFQLNYQKADIVRKLLHIGPDGRTQAHEHSLLSARGSAIVDAHSNQLLITDTAAALARVGDLIEKIDIASRQVLIQANIVEADYQFSRNLGVRLGFSSGGNGAALGNAYASTSPDASATAKNAAAERSAVNLPARAIAGLDAGRLALSLFNASAGRFLTLELSALEADGKGRIVSNPRVVTTNQQAALIEQGEEMPYQQAAGNGVTATSFKKANLRLEVTPQITPDGQIILKVDINKDSRGQETPGGLAINTKHVRTQVQVENGGTVMIGGIYTETNATSAVKVPLLGDLPLIGNLFKNSSQINDKTELLIFLTPKIVGSDD